VARAALAAAEQRISSLEAALAQSSSVTVSMTSQIAQTMADTTAQVSQTTGTPSCKQTPWRGQAAEQPVLRCNCIAYLIPTSTNQWFFMGHMPSDDTDAPC
jgi:hypothetical protein